MVAREGICYLCDGKQSGFELRGRNELRDVVSVLWEKGEGKAESRWNLANSS